MVQATRQYHEKAVEILGKVGFARGNVNPCLDMKNTRVNVNPCLDMKKNTKGIIYIASYVDDDLMIGNPEAIDKVLEQLKKNGLVLKVSDSLQDYLLCEIRFSQENKKAWLFQPSLIDYLEKSFVSKL